MCQEELLVMSQRDRLRMIRQVLEDRLSQVDAAEQLGLTSRHPPRRRRCAAKTVTGPAKADILTLA